MGVCFRMASIDQKERYRQQTARCYELVATMSGDRATWMVRLAETYAALAEDPDAVELPAIYVECRCEKCGKKMRLTPLLHRSDALPAMRAFRCDSCGRASATFGRLQR
jgi:hypothetical protein